MTLGLLGLYVFCVFLAARNPTGETPIDDCETDSYLSTLDPEGNLISISTSTFILF